MLTLDLSISIYSCTSHETVQKFLCQESSARSSVNPEVNQSEAGPEIADDTQLYGRDGKL
jgi:hypothetical protein